MYVCVYIAAFGGSPGNHIAGRCHSNPIDQDRFHVRNPPSPSSHVGYIGANHYPHDEVITEYHYITYKIN